MFKSFHHWPLPTALAGLAACCLMTGCGGRAKDAPETYSVSGYVSLDGQPLADASVTFLPQDITAGLQPASGRTNKRGGYQLSFNASQSGTKAGAYRVAISTARQNEDADIVSPETLPAVYNQKSKLMAIVSKDDRVFDFPLESTAGPLPPPRPVL